MDKKRKEDEFQIGDEVMLSTENLALKPGKVKKLAPKYIGPLKVTKTFANGWHTSLKCPESLDLFMTPSTFLF